MSEESIKNPTESGNTFDPNLINSLFITRCKIWWSLFNE